MDIQSTNPIRQTKPLTAPLAPTDAASATAAPAVATPAPAAQGDSAKIQTGQLNAYAPTQGQDMGSVQSLIVGNPQAAQDLQTLQSAGKLTPDVVAGLQKLATQPVAPGVDRKELMTTALRQLADPSSVNQGDRNTCAAAVVQMALAKNDPAEYLHVLGGLASPEGKVTMKNGDTLTRDSSGANGNGRSEVDNLMQGAMSDYAEGGEAAAKARGDVGMYADEQDKLQSAVTGKATTSVFNDDPSQFPKLQSAMQDALAAGKPVSAILNLKDANGNIVAGHSVEVTKIENGRVYVNDPKSGPRSMSLAEFQSQAQSVGLPKENTAALPKPAANHSRGVLAGCGNPFKAIGHALSSAFKGIAGVFGKIAPFLSIAMSFIPGLNVVGWAMKAFQIANALVHKDWAGAIGGVLGGIGGKVAEFAGKAMSVVKGFQSGGIMGALGAASGAIGGPVGGFLSKAAGVVSGFKSGGIAGALGAIGGAVGGDAGKVIAAGGGIAKAVETGDIGGALGAVGGAIGGDVGKVVAAGGGIAKAVKTGDLGGALSSVGGALGKVAGETGATVGEYLSNAGSLVSAVKSHDIGGALSAAGDTVGGTVGDFLSKGGAIASGIADHDAGETASALKDAGIINDKTAASITSTAKTVSDAADAFKTASRALSGR